MLGQRRDLGQRRIQTLDLASGTRRLGGRSGVIRPEQGKLAAGGQDIAFFPKATAQPAVPALGGIGLRRTL